MKTTISIVALVALAGIAQASSVNSTTIGSITFNNKASIDAQGDADNARDSWIAGAGGSVNSIRVTGSLTRNQAGTFVSEARVRLSAGAGNSFSAFNVQASTVGAFPATTVAVGPTTVPVTPFTLAPGQVDFEWFESVQDGTAGLPESTWDTVTYDFTSSSIVNGGAALGALAADGSTLNVAGSHVSGGLDFFTFNLASGVGPGGYLNLQMVAGPTGTSSMTDTEFALYGPDGNLIATDDDGNVGLFSFLTFGADPFANANTDPAGADGASLLAGNYTLVTGGFNTGFAATVNGAHVAGTNAGTYGLSLSYVPTPGSLAFLGLAAIAGGRRRR